MVVAGGSCSAIPLKKLLPPQKNAWNNGKKHKKNHKMHIDRYDIQYSNLFYFVICKIKMIEKKVMWCRAGYFWYRLNNM